MKRFLVDVNVLLDALLDRAPHRDAATRLWAAIERRQVTALVPAHAVTTVFSLLLRARGAAAARRGVSDLLTIFGVAAVDEAILRRALALAWTDFEDAVCAAAAEAAGCQWIVTRDPEGFRSSPVPTVDAASAVALLDRMGSTETLAEPAPASYQSGRKHPRRAVPGGSRRAVPATR